jgi:hypothetical protein
MVHAHRVVGGDRPVLEAPRLALRVLLTQPIEDLRFAPETQRLVF